MVTTLASYATAPRVSFFWVMSGLQARSGEPEASVTPRADCRRAKPGDCARNLRAWGSFSVDVRSWPSPVEGRPVDEAGALAVNPSSFREDRSPDARFLDELAPSDDPP